MAKPDKKPENTAIAPRRTFEKPMSVSEVCEAMGFSRSTLDRERRLGLFPQHLQSSRGRISWLPEVIEAERASRLRNGMLSLRRPKPKEAGTYHVDASQLELALNIVFNSTQSAGPSPAALMALALFPVLAEPMAELLKALHPGEPLPAAEELQQIGIGQLVDAIADFHCEPAGGDGDGHPSG